MRLPADPVYDLRQLGPRFLVLDDQYSVLDGSLPPGRGLVLRWRDGQVTPFTDGTLFVVPVSLGGLATIEIAGGMPVVRTLFDDRWVVTVHDPTTGSVLYRDTRPPARGR